MVTEYGMSPALGPVRLAAEPQAAYLGYDGGLDARVSPQTAAVGVSGAIAGVLSGYIVLFPKGIGRMFLFLGPFTRITRVPALMYLLFWFVMQFFNGVASLGVATAETGGVAYWAHIGGFVAGLLLAFLYKRFLTQPGWAPEA
jgi:membrane associated rhomboid family serine protease